VTGIALLENKVLAISPGGYARAVIMTTISVTTPTVTTLLVACLIGKMPTVIVTIPASSSTVAVENTPR
jgi:hypothetical protein